MIPRIHLSSRHVWSSDTRSAFQRWPKQRALRICIDLDSFVDHDPLIDQIRGFGGHEAIRVRQVRLSNITFDDFEGAVVHFDEAEAWFIRSVDKKRRFADKHARGRSSEEIHALLCRLVLCDAAELRGMDALISASSDMHVFGKKYFSEANILTAEDSLALIGLYLRAQGNFTYVQSGRSIVYTGRSSFFETVALSLLPEAGKWTALCPGADSPWVESTNGLANAVIKRFERALRARDRIHEQLMLETDDDTIDEALFFFDVLLVSLLGAFDAVARVTHRVYQLPSEIHRANWISEHRQQTKKSGWLFELSQPAPQLAALMMPHSPARDVIEMIAPLRNTVHAQPLQPIGQVGAGFRITRYSVILPSIASEKFIGAAKRLGGKKNGLATWGLDKIGEKELTLELDTFVERIVPAAADAVTSLMTAVQIENLTGASQHGVYDPPKPDSDPERELQRHAVLLAGFPLKRPREPVA